MNELQKVILLVGVCLVGFTGNSMAVSISDEAKKIHKIKLMAERGDAKGQLYLGMAYQDGKGVSQDYKEANKWFRLSAGQGNSNAQYNLGYMYISGQGVHQDYVLAHMWYNIASSNAVGQSRDDYIGLRDSLETLMTAQQIASAQALARKCISSKFKDCWHN